MPTLWVFFDSVRWLTMKKITETIFEEDRSMFEGQTHNRFGKMTKRYTAYITLCSMFRQGDTGLAVRYYVENRVPYKDYLLAQRARSDKSSPVVKTVTTT